MIVDLPLDIWQEMASYLTSKDVVKYRSVDRVFFTIETMEIHHTLRFYCLDHRQDLEDIDSLVYRFSSQHIHTWNVQPTSLAIQHDVSTGLNPKKFRRYADGDTKSPARLDQLLEIMHGLYRVGSTLRVLRLDLSLERYGRLILSTSQMFPWLENLTVVFSCEFMGMGTTSILLEVVAPFVNNHYSTLRVLRIHWHRMGKERHNIASFLLRLRHFPCLETFELSHDFISLHESDSSGLHRMLRLHASQLRDLSLHISRGGYSEGYCLDPTPKGWYEQEFLQVRLTKLEVLDLATQMFFDIRKTAAYLHQFENTLTSLTLKNRCLSFRDVQALVSAFATKNALKKLSITVYILNPSLFALLAEKLSHLEILHLKHRFLRSPSAFQFCDTIGSYSFACWKLRSLSIVSDEWGPENLARGEGALRAALPGLETLTLDYLPPEDTKD